MRLPMREFTNTFLLVYAGLFPIVNPVGSAPIFLGLTSGCSEAERNSLALRVSINSFLLLLGSVFVGSHVLEFFGITLPAVRVAGGLVVSAFAWKLLHTEESLSEKRDGAAAASAIAPTDAFYPLTMPLTVGPGSMSVAITLGSQRPVAADLTHIASLLLPAGAAIAGLVAIAFTCYICYRFGEDMTRLLGRSGTSVLVRLSAFILLCIGVDILWSGYSAFLGHGS